MTNIGWPETMQRSGRFLCESEAAATKLLAGTEINSTLLMMSNIWEKSYKKVMTTFENNSFLFF
ncbi:hypothetical protein [Lysinibacillus sp. NPDC093692]|uniref:hypothetical protein n=1 Tax=Lysinibacillus sp. NPDC093692 TaxID=3390578 RepID=UPI003D091118